MNLESHSRLHVKFWVQTLVSGSPYHIDSRYYPGWGGIAQLEQEGVLEEVKFDPVSKKAIFLLKKDLPSFLGIGNKNSWKITLILDRDTLKVPHSYDDYSSNYGADFCIFNRAGDYIYGHEQRCTKSDLGALQKKPKAADTDNSVYLRMDRFIPALSAEHDSFDIELKIDKKRCVEFYGDDYVERCKIPDALKKKEALSYVLTLEPGLDGQLSWKDENTLTFTPAPASAWDFANTYQLSLELGHNVLINGQKKGITKFTPAAPFFEISNLKIEPDDLNPDRQIITADIQSNYQLNRFDNIEVCHLPMGSLAPDAFFAMNTDCQGLPTEAPMADLAFEMKDGRGRIKQVLPIYDTQAPSPTYLWLNMPFIPSSTAGGTGQAVAYFKDPEDQNNYSPEVNDLIAKAKSGDAQTQFELGKAYFYGEKIDRSLYRAHKWFLLAARQDVPEAWLELGKIMRYKTPDRLYYSDSTAFYWLSKAANGGQIEAQYELGLLHGDNQSPFIDGDLSVFWLKKAAEKNYIPALIRLGHVYEEGFTTDDYNVVVKPDYVQSRQYYQAALDQGNIEGLAHLARFYFLGPGVDEDHNQAYEYAKKAILQSTRSDLVIRDNAAKILAEILLEQAEYPFEKDKVKARAIADRVFKEFPKDYMRMWIAASMPAALDTVKQRSLTFDLPVVEALVEKQEAMTPDLPEVQYVKALILLNQGFSGKMDVFNVYYLKQLKPAVKLLEPLLNDPNLDHDAMYLLAECYAATNARKKMASMFDYAAYQKYYTQPELAHAFAWGYERLLDHSSIMAAGNYYALIGDREGIARVHFRNFGHADLYLKDLTKRIKNSPGQIPQLLEYAGFVYFYNGDYEQALIAAHKALKINPDHKGARWMAGIAYFAKASQINKKDGFTNDVRKHMNAAKVLGIHKWSALLSCGIYCEDFVALFEDYYTEIGVVNDVKVKKRKKEEIRHIEHGEIQEKPL